MIEEIDDGDVEECPLPYKVRKEHSKSFYFDPSIKPSPPNQPCNHVSTKTSKPLPVPLGKAQKQGFKVFCSFHLALPSKIPQSHEKWLPMGQGIQRSIFHPSGMVWRPFRGCFLQILETKGVCRSLFLCIYCIYKTSKPLPVPNVWKLGREVFLT